MKDALAIDDVDWFIESANTITENFGGKAAFSDFEDFDSKMVKGHTFKLQGEEEMLESEKRAEAALYYLYMMSDGKVTYDEEILFDKICKELQVTEEMKRNIISDCKVKARGEHEIFLTVIRDKIDEL